ncbi:Uncharacterised protein [Mycobacteroides abscessus subsp. abscessus]|nr:Uncharacterised protein [Mycobacteroides abscessus subsp. abscessus]
MTSARHSVRGTESPRLAYRGSWACENSEASESAGGGVSKDRRHVMNCSSPNSSRISFLSLPCSAP